jgi:hypothetical protein
MQISLQQSAIAPAALILLAELLDEGSMRLVSLMVCTTHPLHIRACSSCGDRSISPWIHRWQLDSTSTADGIRARLAHSYRQLSRGVLSLQRWRIAVFCHLGSLCSIR